MALTHPDMYPALVVNQRVRFFSDEPTYEPIATIIEVGYCGVRLAWDDGHEPTMVMAQRLSQLEVL